MKHLIHTISWAIMLATLTSLSVVRGKSAECAVIVPADSIKAELISELIKFASGKGQKIDVTVPVLSNIQVDKADQVTIKVIQPDSDRFKRMMPVWVELLDSNGVLRRKVKVSTRVRHYKTVAVASALIERNDKLNGGLVTFQEMDIASVKGYFTSLDELRNMESRKKIKEGVILTKAALQPEHCIKRGDIVTVMACVGKVKVKSQGKAREDGVLHENIRIYNTTSKRTLNCIVLDENTVRVAH